MFVSCCQLNVFFSISCRKQPRRFFFHSPQPKILQNSEARSLNKCLTVGNFTGNKFYGIFQGFIFPTTPALELFFRPSLKGFLPVRFFPAILNRSETTLSKRHVLHQFRVQHPSFAVDAAGFTPTQDLENTNKLILNPHHTFFSRSHMFFSCCQRTKSHFLDGSSWECFFVGVRYGTPHQKMKFDWLD